MPTAPFDTIQTILDAARVRLNDAIQSLGGDVLTDNAVFTTQLVNNAWRRFQRRLAALGYTVLEKEFILTGLPAVFAQDAGTQVWIDWSGYYNGNPTNTVDTGYVFPQWMISPLRLWERINGSGSNFGDMDLILQGLPSIPQDQWNLMWEWRDNKVYMPGALTNTDLRMRAQAYLSDFTNIATDSSQLVPMVQVLDPFSYAICSEMSNSRGDLDGKSFDAMFESSTAMVADRLLMQARGLQKTSEAGKMADRLTPNA